MIAYQEITMDPVLVHGELQLLINRGIDENSYYAIRQDRPRDVPNLGPQLAAWVLYMNATSYNGLWRENRAGGYNVPYGQLKTPRFRSLAELSRWATRAKDWTFWSTDGIEFLTSAGPGDVVYCDPPYVDTRGGYVSYVSRFTHQEQARLVDALVDADRRGVAIIASDAGASCDLYTHFATQQVETYHAVGATGARRGHEKEILAISKRLR